MICINYMYDAVLDGRKMWKTIRKANPAREIRLVCERQINNTNATYGSCLVFTTNYFTKCHNDTKGMLNTTRSTLTLVTITNASRCQQTATLFSVFSYVTTTLVIQHVVITWPVWNVEKKLLIAKQFKNIQPISYTTSLLSVRSRK